MLYNQNETMKLVGKQSTFRSVKIMSEVKDIIDAHEKERDAFIVGNFAMLAADLFNLGRIYGKREDRERRKNGKQKGSYGSNEECHGEH